MNFISCPNIPYGDDATPPPLHDGDSSTLYLHTVIHDKITSYLYSQNGVFLSYTEMPLPCLLLILIHNTFILSCSETFLITPKRYIGNTVGIKASDLIIRVYRKRSKCRVSIVNNMNVEYKRIRVQWGGSQ